MSRYEVVTLFPEIAAHFEYGLLGKAIERGLIEVETLTPREFTADRHRSVDDAPYGGGSGMVLSPPPILAALDALDRRRDGPTRRILLTPQGRPFRQDLAEELAKEPCLTFLCGRYEGFDERIRNYMNDEISIGDFVLLGGESAAITIVEAIARLVPGVLGNAHSAVEESFSTGILEHPQYTRPAEFRGLRVPDVLLSGNHASITRWRRKEALRRTLERRPELLESSVETPADKELLREIAEESS